MSDATPPDVVNSLPVVRRPDPERVWSVTVGVALSRPPTIDEYRHYKVWARNGVEAELIAQQMAACTSVMPVWSVVEE